MRGGKNRAAFLDALRKTQSIVFAPVIFQVALAAKRTGLLTALAQKPISLDEMGHTTKLNQYSLRVLLDVLLCADIVSCDRDYYTLTKVGECLLYDQMSDINMNFVADICYKGLASLQISLENQTPEGLKSLGPWKTIYEGFENLSKGQKDSWYRFDHYHSELALEESVQFINTLTPYMFFDIGGNTGRLCERLLKANDTVKVKLFDLPHQCQIAQEKLKGQLSTNRFCTVAVDWLDQNKIPRVSQKADVIWMSQFLSCFSDQQVVHILKIVMDWLEEGGVICISDCVTDRQINDIAQLSVTCTSTYFAAIANGNSRFRSHAEMVNLIQVAGLQVRQLKDHIGLSHTVYVCESI